MFHVLPGLGEIDVDEILRVKAIIGCSSISASLANSKPDLLS
jgi:hypothetical protein